MRLLDLYCCADGAGVGYHRAGFDVVGVDIASQKRYPFQFVQADALEYVAAHGHEFDVIHASPPCQFASEATPMKRRSKHENLIPATRRALMATGKPYVIENVENARRFLHNPLMLCGSMFGLPVWRHRYFECYPNLMFPPAVCNHARRPVTFTSGSHSRKINRMSPVLITGTTRRSPANGGRFDYTLAQCREAIECEWMTRAEIDQAIPPAYTEYIGRQFIDWLRNGRGDTCSL